MENFIALDLSSTVCGYTIYQNNELKDVGYKKLTSEVLLDRGQELKTFLDELINSWKEKDVVFNTLVIEAHMKSFSGGKSSGDAMFKTGQMNFLGRYLCRFEYGMNVVELNVNSARNTWKPGFIKLARSIKNVKDKEIAFDYASKELIEKGFELPTKVLKSGPRKGETVFLDEASDITDSYVLGEAYLKR